MSTSLVVHPLWLRVTHWLNAASVFVLMFSGWRIYNATAFVGFEIPHDLTLGGWLGGALQWHFASMWVLACNGALYLTINIVQGRLRRKFFPITLGALWCDVKRALNGQLSHADPSRYNSVQRLAYVFVILDSVILLVSGLVLWKSVQFPILRSVLGGYEAARWVHFVAMATLAGFVVIHLAMVALVPKSLVHMLRGN